MADEVKVKNPNGPAKKSFGGAIKEWFRKRIVALKVKPQIIPLVFMAAITIYFMLILFKISQAIDTTSDAAEVYATGICTFITTLLSLLYLVSFLNSFPKHKKPNIFFIVLTGVMMAAQIACDIVFYVQMSACAKSFVGDPNYDIVHGPIPYVLAHAILLGVAGIVFALLPVYAKLIRMINTTIKLESASENMHGEIDIEEDD